MYTSKKREEEVKKDEHEKFIQYIFAHMYNHLAAQQENWRRNYN